MLGTVRKCFLYAVNSGLINFGCLVQDFLRLYPVQFGTVHFKIKKQVKTTEHNIAVTLFQVVNVLHSVLLFGFYFYYGFCYNHPSQLGGFFEQNFGVGGIGG